MFILISFFLEGGGKVLRGRFLMVLLVRNQQRDSKTSMAAPPQFSSVISAGSA